MYTSHLYCLFNILSPVYEIQWVIECAVGILMILLLYKFKHFQKLNTKPHFYSDGSHEQCLPGCTE